MTTRIFIHTAGYYAFQNHLVEPCLTNQRQSHRCTVEWMTPQRFDEVHRFFNKHDDKEWSFTDCTSFCVMRELELRQALAADVHFRQAGFDPLLVNGAGNPYIG